MNATRLYPGMCDGSLEIFFHHEEQKLKAIENGSVKCFRKVSETKKEFLKHIIRTEADTRKVLKRMFPAEPEKQIEKLAKCRFGGLNFQADFCKTSNTVSHDYVECIIRRTCAGCGIICKNMQYNGAELSQTDINAITLMATTDYKTEVLAEELRMPVGSFHVYRTDLYHRVGVKSKPELARVGVELGLI